MPDALTHDFDLTPSEAIALQRRLREQVVASPPPGFDPRLVGGADLSLARHAARAYAGIVVIDIRTMETVEEASAVVDVTFPYVPGLLAFRELPAIAAVWGRLGRRPDALVFDGHGFAHPRRFGIACFGGLLLDVPSVGCAKSILVGRHGALGRERGATAPLVDRDEVVGTAVRTRDDVSPVYVSIGHRMDLDTAVSLVLGLSTRFREPETTRRAHRLVNALRRAEAA